MASKIDLAALTPEQRAHVVRQSFRNVFASPEGEVVREELRRVGRYYKTSHVLDDPNGRRSANLEGRKFMTMYVEAMCASDDNALIALLDAEPREPKKEKRRG